MGPPNIVPLIQGKMVSPTPQHDTHIQPIGHGIDQSEYDPNDEEVEAINRRAGFHQSSGEIRPSIPSSRSGPDLRRESNYRGYDDDVDTVKPEFWLILEIGEMKISEDFDYKGGCDIRTKYFEFHFRRPKIHYRDWNE